LLLFVLQSHSQKGLFWSTNDLVWSMQKLLIFFMWARWCLQCHANPADKKEGTVHVGSSLGKRTEVFLAQGMVSFLVEDKV
jgi:hypothetical protein